MTPPDESPDPKKFDMGKMARDAKRADDESAESQEIIDLGEADKTRPDTSITIKPTPNILDSSDNAWLEGTRGLQRNLIRQLQEARASFWEGRLIGAKRQQVIKEVTEQYVMFLREEARMTSETALQARKTYLERELLNIKSGITKELADMTGKSIRDIEEIFQSHVSQLETEELRNAYARYVLNKIFDLMGMEPPK